MSIFWYQKTRPRHDLDCPSANEFHGYNEFALIWYYLHLGSLMQLLMYLGSKYGITPIIKERLERLIELQHLVTIITHMYLTGKS